MPLRLTADTGIDSLTHAIEAYVSRRANPYTDGLAKNAMGLIAAQHPHRLRRPGQPRRARGDDARRDDRRAWPSPTPASRWCTA